MKIVISIIVWGSICSCSLLIKTIYGVRDPNRPISRDHSLEFIRQFNLPESKVLFPKNYDSAYAALISIYDYLPGIIMFNERGNCILIQSDRSCTADIESFLIDLSDT